MLKELLMLSRMESVNKSGTHSFEKTNKTKSDHITLVTHITPDYPTLHEYGVRFCFKSLFIFYFGATLKVMKVIHYTCR